MTKRQPQKVECLVISGSAGAIEALNLILPQIPKASPFPVVCVLHMGADAPNLLVPIFQDRCECKVKEAESTEPLQAGTVYFCPPDYHLSIEKDRTFSLSNEPPVKFSRPSIDVFFLSAASAYRDGLCAILLSGANDDGAEGLQKIHLNGGFTIVQSPETAGFPTMPEAAMALGTVDAVLPAMEIGWLVKRLASPSSRYHHGGAID